MHGVQGYFPAIEDVLNYLSHLFEKQKEYRTINCSRSMLSSTINTIDGFPVGKHPMVVRLMRGIFNKRPPSKPLFPAWSVSKVLELFTKWAQAKSLSLKQLTLKCVMLLALATAKRASSLNSFSIKSGYFELAENSLVIQPLGLEKTTRPGHKATPISLETYKDGLYLCPVTCVRQYIRKTKVLRNCDALFVSYMKPHKAVTTQTICRWLKSVISMSGQCGNASSTRSVSTSTALGRGITLEDILQTGDWTGARTFRNHYYKPVAINDLLFPMVT